MTPKTLVIGKRGSIVHWLENSVDGFAQAGAQVGMFCSNGCTLPEYLRLKLARFTGRSLRPLQTGMLARRLESFRPDLVLFIGAFWIPTEFMHTVRSASSRPLLAGWVGDRFVPAAIEHARTLDRIYYTDSRFLDEARTHGFPDNGAFLPLAVNPDHFRRRQGLPEDPRMVFVANPTPHRMEVVRAIRAAIVLHGRHWNRLGPSAHETLVHEIHARRLPMRRLPEVYSRHRAVLNIRNEGNVLAGLSQRSFEPAACGTPVLNDAMEDLERCFEPGREILVYRDSDELNALYERVRHDAAFARGIGEAARRRVLTEHTYAHRARFMLDDLGLRT
jgi:spore maturation protein CgeB